MPDMPVCPRTLLFALFAILVSTSALNLRTDATSDDWRSEFSKLKAEFDHLKQNVKAENAELKTENGVLQQRVKAQDAKIAWLESQISASGAVRTSSAAKVDATAQLDTCPSACTNQMGDLAAAVQANRQLINQNQAAIAKNFAEGAKSLSAAKTELYNVITAVKNDLKNNYYRWGTHSYLVGRWGGSSYWQVGWDSRIDNQPLKSHKNLNGQPTKNNDHYMVFMMVKSDGHY